jgi:hypothetical protein
VTPCESAGHETVPAVGRATWGLYSEHARGRPHHAANLCPACLDDLWEKSRGLVTTQAMHFSMSPPGA